MALVRCEECGLEHPKREYVRSVASIGYPDTALVCGRANCHQPGMIWLESEESEAFDAGERVFKLQTGTVKVRAL